MDMSPNPISSPVSNSPVASKENPIGGVAHSRLMGSISGSLAAAETVKPTQPPPLPLSRQIQESLSFLKDQVPLFEAAEKVAVPTSDPSNGWFANAGVFKMAELSPDSAEWAGIETTLGRPVPQEEREQAIAAAKTLQQNWGTLYELAPHLGLGTRVDEWGRQVIDFKTDTLNVAANAFIFVGTDAADSVYVEPFSEQDKAVAGEKSPKGEPYVVTVTINGVKSYLTQSQAGSMVFDMRGGNDSVNVSRVPFGVVVFGGDGDDLIIGGGRDNVLDGGAGNDEISGGSGSDTLRGGEGDDWLKGGYGADKLDGGVGGDVIFKGGANDGDEVIDPDTPAALEQRPYLADVAALNQWGGGAAAGVTSVSVVQGPQPVDREGVPSKSYILQAQTTWGTFQFKVVVNDGVGFDSPDQLTRLFSSMPPPYLAAAAQVDEGIGILSDLGGPAGDIYRTVKIRVAASALDAGKNLSVLAHELSHVMEVRGEELGFFRSSEDFNTRWLAAEKADRVPVSGYGEGASGEDLADFGALYFKAYNNPEQLAALKAASPERFRIFEQLAAAVAPSLSSPYIHWD